MQRKAKRGVTKDKEMRLANCVRFKEKWGLASTDKGTVSEKDTQQLKRIKRSRWREGKTLGDGLKVNPDVQWVRKEEVRTTMNRVKNERAISPDDIPMEARRCSGDIEAASNKTVQQNLAKVKDA